MRRVFAALLFVCLFSLPSFATRERIQGWCQDGGVSIVIPGTAGSGTQRFQQSYRSCTVTVYAAGTTTLSTLYSDAAGTAQANPFTSTAAGRWFFYADGGRYDVRFSAGGIPTPFTLGDFRIGDEFLNVRDYGATGNGTTNDSVAIQRAISALPAAGGTILFPPGTYQITTSLNVTDDADIQFVGSTRNGATIIQGGTTGTPLFDLSGARRISFRDLQILGQSGATSPSVGVLLARSTTTPDSGFHFFENTSINGNYTQAAVVSYDSETNTYIHTTIANGTATGYGFYITDTNSLGVTSPYRTLTSSTNTNVATYVGGSISAEGSGGAGGIALWLEAGVDNAHFHGVLMTTGNSGHAIQISGAGTKSNLIFQGIRHEGPVAPTSFIRQTGGVVSGITLDGIESQATVNMYLADGGTSTLVAHFSNMNTSLVTNVFNGATLRECVIQANDKAIVANTAASSCLFIDPLTLTLTGAVGIIALQGNTLGTTTFYGEARAIDRFSVDNAATRVSFRPQGANSAGIFGDGTDADIGVDIQAKGISALNLNTTSTGATNIGNTTGNSTSNGDHRATGRFWVGASNASDRVALMQVAGAGGVHADGTDANISIAVQPKGVSALNLGTTNTGAVNIGNTTGGSLLNGNIRSAGTTFAALGTPSNGTLIYCSDCNKATPCTGAGPGALAVRLGAAWDCNP